MFFKLQDFYNLRLWLLEYSKCEEIVETTQWNAKIFDTLQQSIAVGIQWFKEILMDGGKAGQDRKRRFIRFCVGTY